MNRCTSEIAEIGDYLFENYYSKCPRQYVPTPEQMEQALIQHPDKIVVVGDKEIMGVGIYLTLTEETFSILKDIDITSVEVLTNLLKQDGPHIHFVLVCGKGLDVIRCGIRYIIGKRKPQTISWWNPTLTKLHIYKVR